MENFTRQLTPRLQQSSYQGNPEGACHHQTSEGSPLQLLRYYVCQTVSARVEAQKYYNMIMRAACCLLFFGFLRSNKFTVLSQGQFSSNLHFTYQTSHWTTDAFPNNLAVQN